MEFRPIPIVILLFIGAFTSSGCTKDKEDSVKPQQASAAEVAQTNAVEPAPSAKPVPPAPKVAPTPTPAEAPSAKEISATKCGDTECPCTEGSKNKPDNSWTICELATPTLIAGISCAEGRVVFHSTGQLQECKLKKNSEFEGHMCRMAPVSSQWYSSGKLKKCSAANDAKINGYTISKYQEISLYENGSLRSVFLKEPRELDGIQCTKGIRWFADGSLQSCTLAKKQSIEENPLPEGTTVVWNQDRSIRGLWNQKPIRWAKKKYDQKERGNWLCFADGAPDPEGFGCNRF